MESSLARPLAIGGVRLEHPLVLAPMAGVCNLAFRLLCKEQGAALVCSGFLSADGLAREIDPVLRRLKVSDRERPVSIQLFGTEPDVVARAARLVEAAGADLVDFNLGCPVPKVLKAEAGAALMRAPDRAQRVLEAMVRAVKIPVTVKMRAGWDDRCINVADLARRFEAVGVAAVAVHARTALQRRHGQARWGWIAEVKAAVCIPVIGNGDVFDPPAARRMLEETGCDGVMIGRGALGNPWIFRRTLHYLSTGELLPEPSAEERVAMALRHLDLLVEFEGVRSAGLEMRRHAACYTRGLPHSAALRRTLETCRDPDDYRRVFEAYLAGRPADGDRAHPKTGIRLPSGSVSRTGR